MSLCECSKPRTCLSSWFKISSGGCGATDAQGSESQDFSESKLEISTMSPHSLHVLQREEMCRSILVTQSHWIFMEVLKWVKYSQISLEAETSSLEIDNQQYWVCLCRAAYVLKNHTGVVKCAMSWWFTVKLVNSSEIQQIRRNEKQSKIKKKRDILKQLLSVLNDGNTWFSWPRRYKFLF